MYGQLEQLKYINHLNEEVNFGHGGMYVNESDLHDFSWSVVSVNDRISNFERGMQTRTIPVRIACVSQSDGIMKRNRLFENPEKDVLAVQPGKLVVNGYYCECYVTASKKSRYSISDRYMEAALTITTDRPVWIKETLFELDVSDTWTSIVGGGIDYPYDFSFDYAGTVDRQKTVSNTAAFDSNFRMEITGLAINPTVYINEHEYQVNTTVADGAVLTIDSGTKKIYVTNGSVVENVFDARNRDSYIFEPLPAGNLNVRWDNSFPIDFYLLEERSEPKWEYYDE